MWSQARAWKPKNREPKNWKSCETVRGKTENGKRKNERKTFVTPWFDYETGFRFGLTVFNTSEIILKADFVNEYHIPHSDVFFPPVFCVCAVVWCAYTAIYRVTKLWTNAADPNQTKPRWRCEFEGEYSSQESALEKLSTFLVL